MKKNSPSFLTLFVTLFFLLNANFFFGQLIKPDVPSVSQYHNSSKKYIEYIPGNMPVIISAPHGGRLTPSELLNRTCGSNEMDDNTDILIREIQKWCYDQYGLYPYIIINNLHRRKLDPNRNEGEATCGRATTKVYYDAFHDFIDDASADISAKYKKGLYIDLHGQSHSLPRIEAGYNLQSSAYDNNLNTTANLQKVTIKNLIENNIQNLINPFEDLVRGPQSLGGLMQTTGGSEYAILGHANRKSNGNPIPCARNVGYRTVPSHITSGNSQGDCDDTNPGNNSYFAGDYYNNIRHGSGDITIMNYVSGTGGNINPHINGGGGTIDGIMTEVNRRVRDLGNIYSSSYGQSDLKSPTVPYFARDYSTVIKKFIDLHYNDFSNFSYANSTYDITDTDPTPTITGISGGTFSSTPGLSINNSSGNIDVSNSTVGNYTVTYLAPNINNYYKKTFNIEISSSLDDASFSYPKNNYCKGENNPTAIITGETGGIFSSTNGLNFISTSNGKINLNTSSPGTYTITYTTTNPGQSSSSFQLTVTPLENADFSYSATAYCVNGSDPTPSITGATNGTFSAGNGLSINPTNGAIDLSDSTPGTYTVTYATNGNCSNSATVSITVTPLENADFSYASASYDVNDSDPAPIITGTSGGTFSSSAGIILDSATGSIDLSASNTGNHIITYTVNGTCGIVMNTFDVEITGTILSIIDEEFGTFNLYPNPTRGLITIKSNTTITKVIIHDILGKKIKTVRLDVNNQIDLTELEKAIYLLSLYNENRRLGTKPIIKK